MSELAPIVVGGILTLAGGAGAEYLRDRRASTRDDRQRQESRQQSRDDFQRETLIDLQDSLQKYVRGIGAAVHFDTMAYEKHGRQFLLPDDLSDRIHEAQVLTTKLASRVEDDQIRSWVAEVIQSGSGAVIPGAEEPSASAQAMGEIAQQAQEKMGSLIRSL